MQSVPYLRDGEIDRTALPDAGQEVLQGVLWGRPDELLTPAYWAMRCLCSEGLAGIWRSGATSLTEEIGFGLLGGHGVTADLNSAAFARLNCAGVFSGRPVAAAEIERLLAVPLMVAGRSARYRYPRQRAIRIEAMLPMVAIPGFAEGPPLVLRDRLLRIPGIGPKTASWIVRNYASSDEVAILDVHVVRACIAMGLFDRPVNLGANYRELESLFLRFAKAISVSAALLDLVIWTEMRCYSPKLLTRLDFHIG